MAKYTHDTAKYVNDNRRRGGAFAKATTKLRTRKRVAANFVTAERIFGSAFPAFGAPLGTAYDQTNITKTNRNPSVA